MSKYEIHETTNYSKFKTLVGNRERDRQHIARLEQSHLEYPLLAPFKPVVVNEKMEVIDGQHTLWARENMGETIYYVVANGAVLQDVQILNTLIKPWTPVDFAKSYILSGKNPAYPFYLKIREVYNLAHRVAIIFMRAETNDDVGNFRKGTLAMPDEDEVIKNLKKMQDLRPHFPHAAHTPGFSRAIHSIMQSPEYDHDKMIEKAKERGYTVANFARREDFLRALEDVYNWKEAKKVRFDYKSL